MFEPLRNPRGDSEASEVADLFGSGVALGRTQELIASLQGIRDVIGIVSTIPSELQHDLSRWVILLGQELLEAELAVAEEGMQFGTHVCGPEGRRLKSFLLDTYRAVYAKLDQLSEEQKRPLKKVIDALAST